ncbi:FKBP-type peptidyl-prolyl cis-trans isomerase [Salmonella enterica subsp. enterica serovar Typhimurium]|nr:FKBP-type peptidyl-prolyl cis-trans isomerase [Salmonella enterica subsp. enterica serovar Typhimurium]
MKSLFKATLLATTMAVAMHAPITFAADAAKPAATADSKAAFKNDDQKRLMRWAPRWVVTWKIRLKSRKS